jgi:hypothetical protein
MNDVIQNIHSAACSINFLVNVQVVLEVILTPGMATCDLYLRDEKAFWDVLLTRGPQINPNEMIIQVIDGYGCYIDFVDNNVPHVPVMFCREVHTD